MVEYFKKTFSLLEKLGLSKERVASLMIPYYLFTVVNVFIEGISMVMLINLFTSGNVLGPNPENLSLLVKVLDYMEIEGTLPQVIPLLIVVFLLNLVLKVSLIAVNGIFAAKLIRKLQESTFLHYLRSDWAKLRDFVVGDSVSNITFQPIVVVKFITCFINSIYFSIGAIVLISFSFYLSWKVTLSFGVISFPVVLIMFQIFKSQSKLSKMNAGLRNDFSGDVTDRLNGLLQIKVEDNVSFHFQKGVRTQEKLEETETKMGINNGVIGSFNVLVPLFILTGFYVILSITGEELNIQLSVVASIGALGVRVATQVNGAIGAIGDVSRLTGSLNLVSQVFDIPKEKDRLTIPEPLSKIVGRDISYSFSGKRVMSDNSFEFRFGCPLILEGRSGKGKTTLANLIAGIYSPESGELSYVGVSGKAYSSRSYKARVGFVTQDIYLFRGTLREVLTSGREIADERIWEVLKIVDASDFVAAMGGLDAETAEAGRSLSGGQRRRIGIARVLLGQNDILIFDEITSGLDSSNRKAIIGLIEELSHQYLMVIITHDDFSLASQNVHQIC